LPTSLNDASARSDLLATIRKTIYVPVLYKRFRAMRSLSAVFLLLLVSAPALAAPHTDSVPPVPDPPGHWRVLTRDDATTTSRCIGDTSTPLCAVETAMACFYRDAKQLCDVAFLPAAYPLPRVGDPEDVLDDYVTHPTRLRYRILSARRAATATVLQVGPPGNVVKVARGDVLLTLRILECEADYFPPCETAHGPITRIYIARSAPCGWRVMGSSEPGWHFITSSPATTTSRCIGSAKTPLCAIETSEACEIRRDLRLCEMTESPKEARHQASLRREPWKYFKYRILSYGHMAGTQLDIGDRHPLIARAKGDLIVRLLVVDWQEVAWSTCGCSVLGEPATTYILHRVRDHWVIVDAGSPAW